MYHKMCVFFEPLFNNMGFTTVAIEVHVIKTNNSSSQTIILETHQVQAKIQ